MNIKHAIKNLNSMKMNYDQWDKKSIPIQTIDMAIEALEKQIPKEPIEKESGWYYCPTCNTKVPAYANYCCGYYTGKQGCGQRLDWEELK